MSAIKREENVEKSTAAAFMLPLITVWLEVRILPGPPGSLALSEISRLLPNCPELAGSAVRAPVSAETVDGSRAVLAELSLAQESRFPETKDPLR